MTLLIYRKLNELSAVFVESNHDTGIIESLATTHRSDSRLET